MSTVETLQPKLKSREISENAATRLMASRAVKDNDDGLWNEAFSESEPQTYPASTLLYEQGRRIQDVYRLEHGLVKFIHLDPSGREVIISLSSVPGTILGAYCAILETACISIELVTKSRLTRISAVHFRDLLKTDINISWNQHRAHSMLLSEQISKVAQLGCYSVQRRLEMLLCELIQSLDLPIGDAGVRMNLPLKYWEIAQLIAVSPEHLCRVFKSMETEGLLERKKGWIIIPDPGKLAQSREEITTNFKIP